MTVMYLLYVLSVCSCVREEDRNQGIEVTQYTYVVCDSIGSIESPLYMLGVVASSVHHPDGGILVLDRISNSLRWFQPDGEVSVLASEGSGPGCIQRASEMVIAGDNILVLDKGKRSIMRYSLTGEYLDNDTPTGLFEPYGLFGLRNGDILATVLGFQMDSSNEIELYVRVGQYDESLECVTEYYYETWSPPYNGIYSAISLIRYCIGPDGTGFFCPDISDYKVTIYDPNGEIVGEISRPDIERVSRSEEEIEEIRRWQEENMGNEYLFQGENDPSPYKTLIQLAGTDSLGRLWIWNLSDMSNECLHFDIWTAEGELVEQALIDWTNREPVTPLVDSGGVILRSTEEADVVMIYDLIKQDMI